MTFSISSLSIYRSQSPGNEVDVASACDQKRETWEWKCMGEGREEGVREYGWTE